MKNINIFIFCLILGVFLAFVPSVMAIDSEVQDEGTVTEQPILIEGGDTVTAEDDWEAPNAVSQGIIIGGWDSILEKYEDLQIDEPSEIPSTLGLWWRDLKETVATTFTFDPMKKAERQVSYAAERVRLAEYMVENSDDEKIQLRAERVMKKAHKLMGKVESKKDKWLEKNDDRKEKLLKNIGTLQARKEQALDLLEEKIPEEKKDNLKKIREEGQKVNKRLLNALDNKNISENVLLHLQNVKDRIEDHAQEVKQYKEKKGELLQAVKAGDEDAEAELKKLRQERLEKMEVIRLQYREREEALRNSAEAGDEEAQLKLQKIKQNKVQVVPTSPKPEGEGVFSPGGFGNKPKLIKAQANIGEVEVSGSGQAEEPPMETVAEEVLPKIEPVKLQQKLQEHKN